MKRSYLPIVGLISGVLIVGCEPKEPGSPHSNQRPVVRITVAPLDTTEVEDHYIAPEVMFRLQWFGSDPDGLVEGYYLQINDQRRVWTTRGDTAIAFVSNEPDPDQPGKTRPVIHTIRVWAVDNEGLESIPAVRSIRVTNYSPKLVGIDAPFRDSSWVGQGIAFSVLYSDSNFSGIQCLVKVDDIVVAEWVPQTSFRFADITDISILASIDSTEVKVINKEVLTPGRHRLTVRVRDWGLAESDSISRVIFVDPERRPRMASTSVNYGGQESYPDGSVFYQTNAVIQFTMNGSAEDYFGSIQSYRYRLITSSNPDPEWSQWGGNSVEMRGLSPGDYTFQAQCRDYAGNMSDTLSYQLHIVQTDFSEKRIVVVDETRDGNGRPGSPNDEQVDQFYRYILGYDTSGWENSAGWRFTEVDYARKTFISPLDLAKAQVVVWHSDDKSTLELKNNPANIRLLREYLERGGKLILSGWDVMGNFTDADSTAFTSGFVARYLRITSARRANDRVFTGTVLFSSDSLAVDPNKIPAAWSGLDRCWAFTPAHRTEVLAYWYENTPLAGRPAIVFNASPVNIWKTVIIGFPLFFINDDQAKDFIQYILNRLDQ